MKGGRKPAWMRACSWPVPEASVPGSKKLPRRHAERRCRVPLIFGNPKIKPRPVTSGGLSASPSPLIVEGRGTKSPTRAAARGRRPLGCLKIYEKEFEQDVATYSSSYAGLTRVSITLRRSFLKRMDCRVKPGNDEFLRVPGALRHSSCGCAEPGPCQTPGVRYMPASAAHRHGASKTRVNALMAKCFAPRRVRGTKPTLAQTTAGSAS